MKSINLRTNDGQGADQRDIFTASRDSVVGVDSNGKSKAFRRAGGCFDNFSLLPDTAVGAGDDPYFVHDGTGTQVIAASTKGGVNLKSQATTPADGDNVFIAAVATTGMHRTLAAAAQTVFDATVRLNTIATVFYSIGLSENVTDVDPTGTAGEGMLFAFDPTGEFASAVTGYATKWLIASKVNGVDVLASTGITVVAGKDYHLRVEVGTDLIPKYYIDNVLVYTGTTAMTAGDTVKAFAGLELTATPDGQQDMDIRYIEVSQEIG